MALRNWALSHLAPFFRGHPVLKRWALAIDTHIDVWRHEAARHVPSAIQPTVSGLKIAITSHCNLACLGCRYGRDYMPDRQLPLSVVKQLLDDAKTLGIPAANFYGGEPLMHPELPQMVAHATQLGMTTSLTTNAILLKQKVDTLYEAGLRRIGIGFYGVADQYNAYVQKKDAFKCTERSIAYVREHFDGKIDTCLYWLITRPACTLENLQKVWQFVERHEVPIQLSLPHYSFPYFSEGCNRELQFFPEHRSAIEKVVRELIRLKRKHPDLVRNSIMGMRSIPDWLIKKEKMSVPCTLYRKLWIAADGSVYVCQGTALLGNLFAKPLRDVVFTAAHRAAARACFSLDCVTCHADWDGRIQVSAGNRRLYGHEQSFEATDDASGPGA